MEINETITVVDMEEFAMLSDEARQAQWPLRSSCKVVGLKRDLFVSITYEKTAFLEFDN